MPVYSGSDPSCQTGLAVSFLGCCQGHHLKNAITLWIPTTVHNFVQFQPGVSSQQMCGFVHPYF